MKIQFVRPDLHQIDQIKADTFAVCLFEEDTPPRGLAGLLDWRLCGRVSDLLIEEQISGRFREAVLLPGYDRLPTYRVCVYGLGKRADFTVARAREASWFIADSLHKLRASSFIGSLPGSPSSQVAPRARMELFMEELLRVYGTDDSAGGVQAFIVEPNGLHRELTEVVSIAMRKLRAIWK